MCSLVLLGLVASATSTCDVTRLGDPLLVADIQVRMNLARDARTRCEPVTVHIEEDAGGVSVAVLRDGTRFERTVADVDRATVLIESRVFVPEEALAVLELVASEVKLDEPGPPRAPLVAVAPEVARPEIAMITPPRPLRTVFDPETGEARPPSSAIATRSTARPAPGAVRGLSRNALRRHDAYKTVVARPEADDGVRVRVGTVGDVTLIDDGTVWLGPAFDIGLSDGHWSGAVNVRLAKRPTDPTHALVEIQPTLGRDFRVSWGRIEPRATFAVRSIQETESGAWISPCGFTNCNFTTDENGQAPSRVGTSRVDVLLGAQISAVVPFAGPLSLWGSAGFAVPLVSKVEPSDDSAGILDGTAGRISVGVRLEL